MRFIYFIAFQWFEIICHIYWSFDSFGTYKVFDFCICSTIWLRVFEWIWYLSSEHVFFFYVSRFEFNYLMQSYPLKHLRLNSLNSKIFNKIYKMLSYYVLCVMCLMFIQNKYFIQTTYIYVVLKKKPILIFDRTMCYLSLFWYQIHSIKHTWFKFL